jgi:hypothetical protein
MKLNKIFIIILFPLIAEVAVSCCDCLTTTSGRYTHKNILVHNIDNSGSEIKATTANSVYKEAFGIRIKLNREKTACFIPRHSIFIQTAYATSCDCPPEIEFLAKDSVTTIKIFTLNDFDAKHSANSDISDYFKVFDQQHFSFSTISGFLKKDNTTLFNERELEATLNLLLMTPPSLNKNHSFKIVINLSDGRILQGITTPIDLT